MRSFWEFEKRELLQILKVLGVVLAVGLVLFVLLFIRTWSNW